MIVAIVPALLVYMEDSAIIDEEYNNAESQEQQAAKKLLDADQVLKNIPKAEQDLSFTREQLQKAESRLPDNVEIDEILRSIGKSAKTMGVKIALFEPKAEILKGDDYKYLELPLKVSVEANDYSQICEWLDDVAGSKSKIYLKSWSISRKAAALTESNRLQTENNAIQGQTLSQSQIAENEGKLARKNLRLVLGADLSLFKLASASNLSSASTANGSPEGQVVKPSEEPGRVNSQPPAVQTQSENVKAASAPEGAASSPKPKADAMPSILEQYRGFKE